MKKLDFSLPRQTSRFNMNLRRTILTLLPILEAICHLSHADQAITESISIGGINQNATGKTYFVSKQGDKWIASRDGSLLDTNTEKLVASVTPTGATVYLPVAPSTEEIPGAKGYCSYGLLGNNSREKVGYTVCNSAFTKTTGPVKNSGGVLIFTATSLQYVTLDSYKLLSTVRETLKNPRHLSID